MDFVPKRNYKPKCLAVLAENREPLLNLEVSAVRPTFHGGGADPPEGRRRGQCSSPHGSNVFLLPRYFNFLNRKFFKNIFRFFRKTFQNRNFFSEKSKWRRPIRKKSYVSRRVSPFKK